LFVSILKLGNYELVEQMASNMQHLAGVVLLSYILTERV